jgi:Resolvase, N terminal domain
MDVADARWHIERLGTEHRNDAQILGAALNMTAPWDNGSAKGGSTTAILVTELSRWGRSTQDLVQMLDDLHGLRVGVLA